MRGHTYVDDKGKKIVVSHIPMGMVNSDTKLLINAGAIITPDILIDEMEKYKEIIGNRKIYIHPRAMIIQEKHRDIEKKIIRSGSTFKGCGAALAEKVMRVPKTILMKDYINQLPNEIRERIVVEDTSKILNETQGLILIEGAQGSDLDINYGLDYPNVTSRQCNASQLLADAGISPFKVKDIIMVIRPYPIRISNHTNLEMDINSGNYGTSKEITWKEVRKRANCNIELKEYTTVTKKIRRVFEMNWERLQYNVQINRPTQIILNFAQYIDWKAYRCKNYEELPKTVKMFIEKIENLTSVPVTMIGTGEKNGEIIDLRHKK